MAKMGKYLSLSLVVILAVSSLLIIKPADAKSMSEPPVPEFTVMLTNHSYDTPSSTSTNQFTGEITTIPGTHVEYQTIDITIKNQPFTPYTDNASGNRVNLLYNIRYRGLYTNNWTILYGDDSYPVQNYSSQFTVVSLAVNNNNNVFSLRSLDIPGNVSVAVEFQVQALIGYVHRVPIMFSGYVFEGQTSDWSSTQTVTVTGNSASPSPAVPEFPLTTLLVTVLLAAGLVLIITKKKTLHKRRYTPLSQSLLFIAQRNGWKIYFLFSSS